ncbi:MAG: PIN domain-containing protein [Gordonia sp. (in: high G+C Gram-positive bacteria)]
MTIIADTGALYACYDRSDAHHAATKDYLGGLNERLSVPALVLAELDHLVSARLGETARASVIEDVLTTASVIPFNQDVAVRAARVAGSYGGFPLGLTDATLVVHAQDHRTLHLFTVDQRHFRSIAPLWGGASFRLLPFDE